MTVSAMTSTVSYTITGSGLSCNSVVGCTQLTLPSIVPVAWFFTYNRLGLERYHAELH